MTAWFVPQWCSCCWFGCWLGCCCDSDGPNFGLMVCVLRVVLQGWKLVGSPDGSSFTLVFRGGAAGIRFSLQDGGPAAGGGARATGSLVLLQGDDDCAAAAAAGARSSAAAGASGALSGPLARQLLRDMGE